MVCFTILVILYLQLYMKIHSGKYILLLSFGSQQLSVEKTTNNYKNSIKLNALKTH